MVASTVGSAGSTVRTRATEAASDAPNTFFCGAVQVPPGSRLAVLRREAPTGQLHDQSSDERAAHQIGVLQPLGAQVSLHGVRVRRNGDLAGEHRRVAETRELQPHHLSLGLVSVQHETPGATAAPMPGTRTSARPGPLRTACTTGASRRRMGGGQRGRPIPVSRRSSRSPRRTDLPLASRRTGSRQRFPAPRPSRRHRHRQDAPLTRAQRHRVRTAVRRPLPACSTLRRGRGCPGPGPRGAGKRSAPRH